MDCARAIVQAGIKEVVVDARRMAKYSSEFYGRHFELSEVLLAEAKVQVRFACADLATGIPVDSPRHETHPGDTDSDGLSK